MIKKIHVDQLRPGIFVHDFNCDWSGENVFINQALIKTDKAIEIIRSWGIKEVYIDTARGFDVKKGTPAADVTRQTDNAIHTLSTSAPPLAPTVPLKEEIKQAREIKKEAVNLVQQALETVRQGKTLQGESAHRLIETMEASISRNKDALLLLSGIRSKDEYTMMHSISVGSLVLAFCKFLHLSYEKSINLATGALFHDVGKMRVPSNILNKPGKLDEREFVIMKMHAEYSAKIMEKAKDLPFEAHDIAMHHHERFDGTGYPSGQKGEEISFGSQITAICDVYDAITSARCYKNGMENVEGLRKIYEWSAFHFNKDLARKFIRCIGVYPVGTCVKLENGLVGVVAGATENVLQPMVRVFYSEEKNDRIPVKELNLSRLGVNIDSYETPNKWDLGAMKIMDDLVVGDVGFT